MRRDNIPTVSLQNLQLEATFFEDGPVTGIKPVLFADDPVAATEAMLANMELAQRDVIKLQKVLFSPESIPPENGPQV
jgi:hypothetical protein